MEERIKESWKKWPDSYKFDITIDVCYDRYRCYIENGMFELAEKYAKKVGIKKRDA